MEGAFNRDAMQRRMLPKKFMVILFFLVPLTISFFKLFEVTINSSTYPNTVIPHIPHNLTHNANLHEESNLATKEYHLLSNLIYQRAPCNLLFFGFKPQLLSLAMLNTKGTTTFLEDDEGKLKRVTRQHGVRIYIVKYRWKASEAYRLLRHAREHFGCKLEAIQLLQETYCRLRLIGLPMGVYERKWDVVVVDGPRGDSLEVPGRMEAIYTAAVLARTGNLTDVFVHDVHRTIEKWYSWEFLCHENLVASKGKLWHFRVESKSKSICFCPDAKFQIV